MYNDFFRPIHYLGSKLRIVEIIKSVIDDIDGNKGPVLDLFSGSGTVSKYLSYERPVTSIDIQEYSRIINSALLLPSEKIDPADFQSIKSSTIYKYLIDIFSPLIEFELSALEQIKSNQYEHIVDIMELGSLMYYDQELSQKISSGLRKALDEVNSKILTSGPEITFNITHLYGGVYFSFEQAIFLDACLNYLSKINKGSKHLYHSAIMSTASDIVNTVGKQFAQPINPRNSSGQIKINIMSKVYKDRTADIENLFFSWIEKYNCLITPKYRNTVIKADFLSGLFETREIGVIYADPPYTRYHYSRYYHVLETIALVDTPQISKSNLVKRFKTSKGVYRTDRHQSPFGIKSQSRFAFYELFRKASAKRASIVLSYSPFNSSSSVTPRILKIDTLFDIASEFYEHVDIVSCGEFSHSKLNKSILHLDASSNAELLIVGRKARGR
jgi:adenine-specific DNA methylase